jgi:hypothetical protein
VSESPGSRRIVVSNDVEMKSSYRTVDEGIWEQRERRKGQA